MRKKNHIKEKKRNTLFTLIFLITICFICSCKHKFEISGEPKLLENLDIDIITCDYVYDFNHNTSTDECMTCYKYRKGKEVLPQSKTGSYSIFVNYKDSLYAYFSSAENTDYFSDYKKKKIKIEENGNFYILYRISTFYDGNYKSCKLKPWNEFLKDSVEYNPSWVQLITNTFQAMRGTE